MINNGRFLEQSVDMAAPLWEKRAAAKTLGMRFQRCPDIDKHVLSGLFDAAFYASRNTFGVLANHFQPLKYALSKLVLFARHGLENRYFCHHVLKILHFSHESYHSRASF